MQTQLLSNRTFSPLPEPTFGMGFFARFMSACRMYCQFHRLPADRLSDMGLTATDQNRATFDEFWNSPAFRP